MGLVHRPSVHVAIISEPNARISFKFWLLLPLGHTLGHFYLCLAMSAELMKLKFVRRPSVGLWHRFSLNFMHEFLSNFSCGFPGAICPEEFLIFEKKN